LGAGGGASPPPSQPLDRAIAQAIESAPAAGVTADVTITSRLFPAGTILGKLASGLLSGSGHVWLSSDGKGRVELETGAGTVSAAWDTTTLSIYVAATNTVYRVSLPPADRRGGGASASALPAAIDRALARIEAEWTLSPAQPGVVAGEPAYSVTASPRESGGLLSSIGLSWDAGHGTPLRLAVYARGSADPVLEVDVTDVAYGAVAPADLQAAFPADATVVGLGSTPHPANGASASGLDAVTAAAGFAVAAPGSLDGLPRSGVELRDGTVFATYGRGLAGLVLIERKTDGSGAGAGAVVANLPAVAIGGVTAHELTTALGTVVTWDAGGISYVLAGSHPATMLEQAVPAVR
jgi:hypothetical protein